MNKFFLIMSLIIGALVFPQVAGAYLLYITIIAFYYVQLASSWNLIAGYTGPISFAHAAFSGIGAYTSALLALYSGVPPSIGILLRGMLSATLSYMTGLISLRLRGPFFALSI